jgi:hypothetical protein
MQQVVKGSKYIMAADPLGWIGCPWCAVFHPNVGQDGGMRCAYARQEWQARETRPTASGRDL